MNEIRRGRISSSLRAEIAHIIQSELKDPRIGLLSILAVELSADLRDAVVKVSPMGTPSEQRTTMRGLQAATRFVQGHLGDRLRMRYIPQLRFVQDDSIKKSIELEELLRRARDEDQEAAELRQQHAAEHDSETGEDRA